jgi:hypothetical protein
MTRTTPESLFVYLKHNVAIATFTNGVFQYIATDKLDDPFECHLAIDQTARDELVNDFQKKRSASQPNANEKVLLERAKANEPYLLELALERYRRLRAGLSVLSLYEEPNNLALWSRYAHQHTGVAIEIDAKLIDCQPVSYSNARVCGTPTEENAIRALLTKPLVWANEKEWRSVKTSSGQTTQALSDADADAVVLEPRAIKRVVLGANVSADCVQQLVALLKDIRLAHVKLERAVVSAHQFELTIIPLQVYESKLEQRKIHSKSFENEVLQCIPLQE